MLLGKASSDLVSDKFPERCPHCESVRFTRYGWFGCTQRYRCKECRRTFSVGTKRLDERIRLGYEFRMFLAGFLKPVPVRVEAESIGVSATTIWRWRHRVLAYLLKLASANPAKMDGRIVIVSRSMSPQRSRWSKETDLLWKRRGAPSPSRGAEAAEQIDVCLCGASSAVEKPSGYAFPLHCLRGLAL